MFKLAILLSAAAVITGAAVYAQPKNEVTLSVVGAVGSEGFSDKEFAYTISLNFSVKPAFPLILRFLRKTNNKFAAVLNVPFTAKNCSPQKSAYACSIDRLLTPDTGKKLSLGEIAASVFSANKEIAKFSLKDGKLVAAAESKCEPGCKGASIVSCVKITGANGAVTYKKKITACGIGKKCGLAAQGEAKVPRCAPLAP